MTSKVYFSNKINYHNITTLFKKAHEDLEKKISPKEKIAIKVHFGEKGNSKFVSPEYIAPIINSLKKYNNNFFITDTNTLYKGERVNATNHKKIAKEHGFYELDSKIIIADGEIGDDEKNVVINGKIFPKVKIGKHIANSDMIIGISHFKGHSLFGFSGIIKNLGMGCGSRAGKLTMHAKLKPTINNNCVGCENCLEVCLNNAIKIKNSKASLDSKLCTGCAKCIAECDYKAIRALWVEGNEVQERCAEYALGAMKNKKGIFFNFINNITKLCDCAQDSEIICEDIGIVASLDPVACDKASYDLVIKKIGKDIFKEIHKFNGVPIFDYSENIGLGKKDYKLITLR
jgi:uncharacterized Fe-S center protein